MKRYIYKSVENMKDKTVFSMPGHKSKDVFDFDYKFDITEVMGVDNLLDPQACILDSEKEVAKIFGVKESFYMVNGSTGALHIAIATATKPGDEILIQRNSHKSIYNALVINDLKPHYINANYNEKFNLFTGINTDELDKKLSENKNIKVVVLTSPNYFGICLNLKEISKVIKKHNGILIVDEAHGSHINFTDKREYSAVNYADFIVHSTHKTMPSLTQSAILHLNSDKFTREDVLKRINLLLTTSPSYLLTQSSEFGVDYMQKYGSDILKRNEEYIFDLKESLKNKIDFFNGDDNDDSFSYYDPTKILFRIPSLSGFEIVKSLFLRYNIRLEMGDLYYGLALSTICDEKSDFEKLKEALEDISKISSKEEIKINRINIIEPEIVYSPRDAFYMNSESVDLNMSQGRVSSSIIAAYPPGVPIVSFGERITKDIINEINIYLKSGIEVIGIDRGRVEVILE
ncbi:aminotransferase class I/II-fold pyridoxal phosphate-dependent enzyme [Peptoniphilus stercorisuis]|uniref:Lysine decarboxylase n=1 Tax=Peptoniphilus stercorisuis TaxID=1436965 RepID=A0ABS4KAU9_9FIRM|nr:aminotransferase class I/II-fold pyridoxal phosphate-dependent enzyme [Peptoniphilus stercorisuis]MBP2024888.1 lysine decarboxylase [Peptoniphilus stercorisuis]